MKREQPRDWRNPLNSGRHRFFSQTTSPNGAVLTSRGFSVLCKNIDGLFFETFCASVIKQFPGPSFLRHQILVLLKGSSSMSSNIIKLPVRFTEFREWFKGHTAEQIDWWYSSTNQGQTCIIKRSRGPYDISPLTVPSLFQLVCTKIRLIPGFELCSRESSLPFLTIIDVSSYVTGIFLFISVSLLPPGSAPITVSLRYFWSWGRYWSKESETTESRR